MSHKSRKRSAKESELDTVNNNSKKRRRSNDSKHSSSSSPKRKKDKHKKSKKHKHKHHANDNDSHSDSNPQPESEWIDHPVFKYKRIDESDYYKYYAEFQHWALNERGKYLDEMSTKKCIKLFNKKFVKKWNGGKLDEKYYKTFSSLSIDNKQKTRFKWSFEKNISSKEQMTLDLARDTVDNETNDNVICDKVAQRFQQRFEQRRQRHKKREDHRNCDDLDFEHDGDGIDAKQKMQQQQEREKQRRYDRKQKWKDKKQKRYMEKQQSDNQMLQSYQSFISSPPTKRKK